MIARRSTPRALRQMASERRYPILLAALAAAHTEIVDELVRLFDQALAGTDSRARDRLAARQAELVAADVGRLMLLVVNACVLSTTGYLEDAIAAQRADGHAVSDEAISHLSPGHYEPINPYGTLNFDVADVTKRPRRSLTRS